ncbi:hypothetical protein [Streptomyces sp. NPDC003730]
MRAVREGAEAVDDGLSADRSALIRRDAARVSELAADGFEGPVHKVFEDELCGEA